jgi:hypothetical protein
MIYWTDYLKYRAALRGFELEKLESIIRHSPERYFDTETERHMVVGRHNLRLVIIAYDIENGTMIPVTVHTITRQQIRFRLNTRRFIHE